MKLFFILPAFLAVLMVPIAFFSISDTNVYAITVNNTDFSVNVLDNWAYRQPNVLAQALDASFLNLIPIEFSELLVNMSKTISGETIQNRGAYVILSLDSEYPYRNVPLEIYSQYNINLSNVKIFSKENTTIDNEPAVKIHRTARNNLTNLEAIEYYVVHKGEPYFLQYAANIKDFQKYLPEFEQMVRTFKFTK